MLYIILDCILAATAIACILFVDQNVLKINNIPSECHKLLDPPFVMLFVVIVVSFVVDILMWRQIKKGYIS